MNNKEEILDFIAQFRELGAENCFANGMCYWFTVILKKRFKDLPSFVMYDPVANHFALKIGENIYDITGDITNNINYEWQHWIVYCGTEPTHSERIYRDCIYKFR